MFISGQAIPVEAIPEDIRPRVGPEGPEKIKSAIAKALLPLPPDKLGVMLGVLVRDPNAEIAQAATESLRGLPPGVIKELTASALPPAVLDVFAHVFHEDGAILGQLVRNPATYNETVRWMARGLRGEILQTIAQNQRRYIEEPKIIEALIANPATPTPLLAPVIETALRSGVDTSGVVGFRSMAEAFFPDHKKMLAQVRGPTPAEQAELEEPEVDEEGLEELELEAEQADKDAVDADEEPDKEGIDEGLLENLLREGTGAGEAGELPDDQKKQALWALIGEMSVAQKVRLAMMGDAGVRSLLVRDPKRVVAMAVLRSPRITEKEIATFAMNKAIGEDIVRLIARTREWTKNYNVRLSLVKNPKCPPAQAMTFLRSLRHRDVQNLARAKDVPAFVARFAKQILNKTGR